MDCTTNTDDLDALYTRSLPIIHACVQRHIKKYGGHYEDLVADASLLFMFAHRRFNPALNKWTTHLYRVVSCELISGVRSNLQKLKGYKQAPLDDVHEYWEGVEWDLETACEKLTEDATTVVALALNPPRRVRRLASKRGGSFANLRTTLRAYLLQEFGWASTYVTELFAEIKTEMAV